MNIFSRLFRSCGHVEMVQRSSGVTYVWLHIRGGYLPVAERIASDNNLVLVPVVGE